MSVDSVDELGEGRRRTIDIVTDAFRPVYNALFGETDSVVISLEEKLSEARMSHTVEVYLSRALAAATLGGLVLGFVGVALSAIVFQSGVIEVTTLTDINIPNETVSRIIDTVRTPFLIAISGLVVAALSAVGIFVTYVAIPYSRAGRRKREINALLPDAVSFMYALSLGGMSQVEIIETMAEAEETYGEVSKEFRTILQETRYFDTDYRTAIQKRAVNTPSSELSQFLTDMLSIIDSGGSMTEFLDDKKEIHFRNAKEDQKQTLEVLELFSEIYITLSIFPLLLIVILVIADMIGGSQELLLYAVVYALIPGLGIAFLILVSTIRGDEFGDGHLETDDSVSQFEVGQEAGALSRGLVDQFTGPYYVFDRISEMEGTRVALDVIRRPHIFLRDNPMYTFAITVPSSAAFLGAAVVLGAVPTTWSGLIEEPLRGTFIYVYVPLFTICLPLAVFWEWNIRRRYAILDGLSENLRKLASANATGLTLLESVRVVADTTPGKLGEEFETIYSKSNYGMHLKESLVVFNNKYRIPRLARTVKLIGKAQEISNQIPSVLSTAARATETQEEIERERRQRAMIQVAIIVMTYLTLLGVMALLKSQFIGAIAEVVQGTEGRGSQNFGGSLDPSLLSLLFFHAVTLQAILSGLVCGYIRNAKLMSGVKYVILLLSAALCAWVVVS